MVYFYCLLSQTSSTTSFLSNRSIWCHRQTVKMLINTYCLLQNYSKPWYQPSSPHEIPDVQTVVHQFICEFIKVLLKRCDMNKKCLNSTITWNKRSLGTGNSMSYCLHSLPITINGNGTSWNYLCCDTPWCWQDNLRTDCVWTISF